MAGQVVKSALMQKYGAKLDNAVKAHATDEYTPRAQNVPPGIRNGIARLTDCSFGQVDQGKENGGEWYFRAAGVVVEPKTVVVEGRTVKAAGCQTSILEMVCETKTKSAPIKTTTIDEHVANILNHLRGLGAVVPENAGGGDMEGIAAAVLEESKNAPGIFFTFSTSQGKAGAIDPKTKKPYPPRVFENWNGPAEDYVPGENQGVVDATGGGDQTDGSDNSPTIDETADHSGATGPEGDDWDSLTTYWATLEDGHEQDELTLRLVAMAVEAGVPEKDAKEAADWDTVKELMDAAQADSGDAAAAEEPFEAVKGGVYNIEREELKDPKNPKKGKVKKKIEVVVETVNNDKRTVTVKDNEKKKLITDPTTKKAVVISWDDLIVE